VQGTPSDAAVYPALQVQSSSAVLPKAELVAEGHDVHKPLPVAVVYFPSVHCSHSPVPVPVLYVPAPQAAHVTPSNVAACPVLQVQVLSAVLADAELVPSGHDIHELLPVDGLYVPAPQPVQATPSDAAVYPAVQVQFSSAVLAEAELVAEGHDVHEPLPTAVL
jgi:hypothetical protein